MQLSSGRCVVPVCDSRRGTKKHMFPKDAAIGNLWVQAVNNNALSSLSYEEIRSKRYWVCCKHFGQEANLFSGYRSLGREAVPTLYLPQNYSDKSIKAESASIDASPPKRLETSLEDVLEYELDSSLQCSTFMEIADIRRSSLKTPEGSPERPIDPLSNSPDCSAHESDFKTYPTDYFRSEDTASTSSAISFAEEIKKCKNNFSNNYFPTQRRASRFIEARRIGRRTLVSEELDRIAVTPKGRRFINESLMLQKELSNCRRGLKRYAYCSL